MFKAMRTIRQHIGGVYLRNTPNILRNRLSDLLGISPLYKQMVDINLIFTHVPKAAGSSISRELYGKNIGHFPISSLRSVNNIKFSDCNTFTVLRDPVERLYSSYKFARQGGTEYMPIYKPGLYDCSEFDTFESFVSEWLVDKDVDSLDPVFKSQFYYIKDGNDIFSYDYIGSVNDLSSVEEWCSDILRRKVIFPNVNITGYSKDIDLNISRETKSIIEKLYKRDFDLFNNVG